MLILFFCFKKLFRKISKYFSVLLVLLFTGNLNAKEIFTQYPEFPERSYVYRFSTERYIEIYGWDQISSGLKSMGLSMVHRNLFDRIWHREEKGFVGYHGSTQCFRVYQDIIRMILEEHLSLDIRKDFHFFRIPGDPQFSLDDLSEYGSYIYDYSPTHFVSLNYALYGNFHCCGCCSYYYFSENDSCLSIDFREKLVFLFEKIGLTQHEIDKAFDLAEHYFFDEKGIILQVFDLSHYNPWQSYYALSDPRCGSGLGTTRISELIQGIESSSFTSEMRMLMTNRHTLNPYASLVIRRYDVVEPAKILEYEQALRECIRGFVPDSFKVQNYRKELLELWGVDDGGF